MHLKFVMLFYTVRTQSRLFTYIAYIMTGITLLNSLPYLHRNSNIINANITRCRPGYVLLNCQVLYHCQVLKRWAELNTEGDLL